MESIYERTKLIIGEEGLEKLRSSKVAVIGIGGVGSFAAEALARAGVGHIVIVDFDLIAKSNINRQIHALHSTLGMPKVEVMKARMLDINPDIKVTAIKKYYCAENADEIITSDLDYCIDAIDSIKSKINLIIQCKQKNVPIISAMGAGNKLRPELFRIADISETKVCPMARVIRRELRKVGIDKGLKVVYSEELPIKVNTYVHIVEKSSQLKRRPPGSISFVPSVCGLIMASEVVRELMEITHQKDVK